LNYGACSQKFFNYNTDNLANSILSSADQNVDIKNPDDIYPKNVGTGYRKPAKVSLVLKSKLSLKLYFDDADVEGLIAVYEGQVLTPVKSDGYTIYTLDGISAVRFNNAETLEFYDANMNYLGKVQYCPAKYCKLILNKQTDEVYTEDLKRVVSALYDYSNTAQELA
jgi:hypothetical protein